MCVGLLPGVAAFADTSYPSNPSNPATIPVSQTVNSGSGTFTYTLTPEDSSAPMPDNVKDGKYTFTLKDTASTSIVIGSTTPGTWYYTLVVEKQDGFTFDTTRYRLGVQYVTDGDTLKANINALADGATADRKAAKVDFKITKKSTGGTPKTPTGTPVSKTGSVKTGDTSQIGLYVGLLCAAGAVLALILVWRRKREA